MAEPKTPIKHPDYGKYKDLLYKHVDELLAIPKVTIIDISFKEVHGKETDQLCISVAVINKLPPTELAAEHLIPAEIGGVPTDVREANYLVRKPHSEVEVHQAPEALGVQVKSLEGGRPLWETGMSAKEYGTLGYFIKMSDGTMGVITCGHVATITGGVMDSTRGRTRGPIGTTTFTSAVSPTKYEPYDVATVTLSAPETSTQLRTGLVLTGTVKVDKSTTPTAFFVGAASVSQVDVTIQSDAAAVKFDDGATYTNMISIKPAGVGGDSGSILVVSGNKAGGLYIGAEKGLGYCHQIEDVLSSVGVTLWIN